VSEPDSGSLVEPKPIDAAHWFRMGVAAKRRNPAARWVIEVVVIVAAVFVLALLVQQFIVKRNVSEAGSVSEPGSGSVAEPKPIDAADESGVAVAAKRRNPAARWVIEVVVIVAAAFVLALLVQQFVVKPFAIPSPSMEPTLVQGDRVLVNRLVYHFRSPRRGDIIVFHPPGRPGSDPFIKRVVGVGGDTIAVHDGLLYVNGVPRDEPFIKEHPIVGEFPETVIAQGYVWAMGDNRNNSGDSRVLGPVSEKAIMGEAFGVYWPLGRIRGL